MNPTPPEGLPPQHPQDGLFYTKIRTVFNDGSEITMNEVQTATVVNFTQNSRKGVKSTEFLEWVESFEEPEAPAPKPVEAPKEIHLGHPNESDDECAQRQFRNRRATTIQCQNCGEGVDHDFEHHSREEGYICSQPPAGQGESKTPITQYEHRGGEIWENDCTGKWRELFSVDAIARLIHFEQLSAIRGTALAEKTAEVEEWVNIAGEKSEEATRWCRKYMDERSAVTTLREENERLSEALADAIRRPMGVIPDSATKLVTQEDLNRAEIRRAAPVDAETETPASNQP